MRSDSRIYVAGHRGLAGSALVRKLKQTGCRNLLTATHKELDLTDPRATGRFFEQEQPEYVFLAAARVGGILANKERPADFIRENLQIQVNVIHSAWEAGVKKLLFLGSSCIYPRLAPIPLREEYLLTGSLEPTNDAYAIAKISGIIMAQAYRRQHNFDAISLMPTNLYGPFDNFDLHGSHVLPALLRKFHEAKQVGARSVTVWGTGKAKREFLHVDDLASAAVFLMQHYSSADPINVGMGDDLSIAELASVIADVVGFEGEILYDLSKPDGTPRKLLDTSRIRALGWQPEIDLRAGLTSTYEWFRQNVENANPVNFALAGS
jgi:GDP-L-fucose synthase